MAEPVFTRGDLVKNFPTSFSRGALEAHFSSEYVKVIGCNPDLCLIQSLAKNFRALWQILKKKECVLTSPRGQAFLSVKLPVPVAEKEKETEKEKQQPRKSFGELSSRGKRYRIESLLTRKPEFDEVAFLYASAKKTRVEQPQDFEQRKKDNAAVLLYYDVNQGKARYIEAAKRHNWPKYCQVQKAKKNVLYPKNICYGENRVEVSVADMICHSTARILEYLYEENSSIFFGLTETEKRSLELWAKVGGDGQGDHSIYSQMNGAYESGGSIYTESYVPLQLKAKGKLLWTNKEPNSPLLCMPLVFTFCKETDDLIQCEEGKLRQQISDLQDISFTVGKEMFCLKAGAVKVYNTMWDGKSYTAIAKTFLDKGKKLASNTCHVCLATPADMNKPSVWDRPIKIPEMLDYSCTPLHMWIRSMEFVFNMAIKTQLPEDLPQKERTFTSSDSKLLKAEMQAKFWSKLKLRVFVVHAGHGGSSNNGNTARHFFKKDPAISAEILKIDVAVLHLFGDLLDMFNNPDSKPSSQLFETKARELFSMLTSPPLGKVPLSQSVHRFLCHGHLFIDRFELPIGALSESALEARNKDNRGAREHHARKISMKANVHDVFNHLLCTSDAFLFMKRH